MPKVSIIIPVYNAENFLKKCLDSIVKQTFKDIEIICVNDGSKDNSLKILNEYQKEDDRIVILDKENEGVSAARNDGIRKSVGEYITFVDADDWLELDAIESIYNVITEKNVDIVHSNCYINNSYEEENIRIGNLCGLEEKLFMTSQADFAEKVGTKILKGELACAVWSLMIRRDVLLQTSLFEKGIHYAEDCILYNELLNRIEKIYFLDKPVYHYYQNPTSCTKASKYYIQNIYSSARAYEKLIEIIENDKFEKENRIKAVTYRFGKIIMDFLFLIYLNEDKTNGEFKALLTKIMTDKTISLIVEKANVKSLPIHMTIPFKLISKQKFRTLITFYNVRKKIRNFRNKFRNK